MLNHYSTFYIENHLYGIDAMFVQEITNALPTTIVPLAPKFIHGLINLRGQIATAVGLRELFDLAPVQTAQTGSGESTMSVVCRKDGMLLSLVVDRIGDVIEVPQDHFETPPDTISPAVGRFMTGVYKMPSSLLSLLEVSRIIEAINKNT